MNTHDPVYWPSHYIGEDGLQAIDVIEDWGLGFHLANAFKYIIRAPKKGSMIQDCEKAIWYLERAKQDTVVKTLSIDNAPCTISTLTVDVAFKVPRGELRDAVDDIFRIALAQIPADRRQLLTMATDAVRRWIHSAAAEASR